jgi:Na+/melibiose symporter-like transporter
MKNNELRNIWVEVDGMLTQKSNSELKEILGEKARKTSRKFYVSAIGSIIICAGVLAFLIIALINHSNDVFYVVNNIVAGVIIIFYLIFYARLCNKLSGSKVRDSLYQSIEQNYKLLSRSLKSKADMVFAPFLAFFLLIAIHGAFADYHLVNVTSEQETLWGLLFGILIAIGVSIYVFKSIRAYFTNQLEKLKYYRDQLQTY